MRKKSIPYCSFQYPSFYYDTFDDKHAQDLRADQCQNDNAEKEKHECHVCRKAFPSQNGLNGHMRIHKKDNKGIPPRPAVTPISGDVSGIDETVKMKGILRFKIPKDN
ncbi:hypothetical protein RYX36_028762 [Vicia faba]